MSLRASWPLGTTLEITLSAVPQRVQVPFLRTLVPKTIPSMAFGTRVLQWWVLGPSGFLINSQQQHEQFKDWDGGGSARPVAQLHGVLPVTFLLSNPTQRLSCSSFSVMTYFLLRDYKILLKKELHWRCWVGI